MTKDKKIKWVCIQPLTGGMYLGAEEAIGNTAECILSFKGLNETKVSPKTKKESCGNEYHLTQYLKKVGRMPEYLMFKDRKMYSMDFSTDVELENENGDIVDKNFEDIDIVVSVPVCSGLSSANSGGNQSQKDERNCNMQWIAKYTLNVIKPKMYIFENAPGLYTNVGKNVREWLNNLAKENNYAITYYKTDTMLHDNCQRRPRTFVIFTKGYDNGNPTFGYDSRHVHVDDFFKRIPEGLTQEVNLQIPAMDYALLKFIKNKYKDTWREVIKEHCGRGINVILDLNHGDEFREFIKTLTELGDRMLSRTLYSLDHVLYKTSIGMGFMCDYPMIMNHDWTPSVIFKTIPHIYHPYKDRYITIREALSLMGMPYDFDLQCDYNILYNQIGQNVPVKTAKFIIGECVRIINNFDKEERNQDSIQFVNNIKQRIDKVVA